jgi:hypothetical protein
MAEIASLLEDILENGLGSLGGGLQYLAYWHIKEEHFLPNENGTV